MITISLTSPSEPDYEPVIAFANSVYTEEFTEAATHRPEHVLVAYREKEIVGCLGLNDSLVSPMFTGDIRFQSFWRTHGRNRSIVDQSFFAVRRSAVAVPSLIASAAAYAAAIGIDFVAYSGISVSCRTIDKLGFDVTTLGVVNVKLGPAVMQKSLQVWHDKHTPLACILKTSDARNICQALVERHKLRVSIDHDLHDIIFAPQRNMMYS